MLNVKFPRSLETLDIDVDWMINPEGYSDSEIKHLIEALEKKSIRAERLVLTHLQTKHSLQSEVRKLTQENKALREVVNAKGDLTDIQSLLEQLTATVVTGNYKHGVEDPLNGVSS